MTTHLRAMIRAFLARLRCAITGHDYSGPPAHRLGLCNDCGLDLDDRRRFARQRGAFLPGHPKWRSRRRTLYAINDWDGIGRQNDAIKTWLRGRR